MSEIIPWLATLVGASLPFLGKVLGVSSCPDAINCRTNREDTKKVMGKSGVSGGKRLQTEYRDRNPPGAPGRERASGPGMRIPRQQLFPSVLHHLQTRTLRRKSCLQP